MYVIQRLQIYPLFFTGDKKNFWSLRLVKAKKYKKRKEAKTEIKNLVENYGIHIGKECLTIYTVEEARDNADNAELDYGSYKKDC